MLIWNVWVKWQSAPIIVTVSDDLVPIEEVSKTYTYYEKS